MTHRHELTPPLFPPPSSLHAVSTWIMQHFAHTAVSLLSLTAPEAVLYSQQFFAAKRLKFILFLRPQDLGLSAQSPAAVDVGPGGEAAAGEEGKLLTIWRTIADAYKEHAIFAYMLGVGDRDTEILQFFHVEASTELPCVGAYDPATDSKFRSTTTQPENAHLLEFVDGVVGGKVDKMLRSEVVVSPLAQQTQQAQLKGVSPVRLFGANVLQEVTKSGADTLLLVYNGPKANYQVRADFDALTSLFAAEKRLLLASIDVSRNDLPSTWLLSEANVGPKSPVLLWFPAGTGASEGRVLPREYITSEYSLENLVDFILQENSYRKGSASSVEEGASISPLQHGPSADLLRAAQRAAAGLAGKYQERGKWVTRNEDRQKMPSAWLDWAAGEVIYDGKRWHVVGAVSVLIALFLESFLSSARLLQKKKENKSLLTRGVQTMGTGTGQAAAADAVGANADITSDTAGIAATKIAAAEPAPILIPSGNKATAAKASSPVKLAKTADPLEVAAKEEGEL